MRKQKITKKLITFTILILAIISLAMPIVFADEVQKTSRTITSNTNLYIDFPQWEEKTKNTVKVQGWVMSTVSDKTVEVWLDGKKTETKITNQERKDVINAVKGYGGKEKNPTPGFTTELDLTNVIDGKHVVEVRIIENSTKAILAQDAKNINVKKYKSASCIDFPKNNSKQNVEMYIQGWVMSQSDNQKLEVKIDNKEIQEITRYERPDVIDAVKDCGTKDINKQPGFKGTINLKNIQDGNHTLSLILRDKKTNEILTSQSVKFKLNKYKTNLYIDTPAQYTELKSNTSIEGWTMSTQKNRKAEVWIDGLPYESTVTYHEREDVIKLVKGYGDKGTNQTPGFKINIDLSKVKDGQHNILTRIIDTERNEVLLEKNLTINLKKYQAILNVDYPKQGVRYKNTLNIDGWIMSDNGNKKVQITLDGKDISNKIVMAERPDVINAVKGYGGITTNAKPGFHLEADISNFSYGEHSVTVKAKSTKTDEILAEQTIKFNVNKMTYSEGIYGCSSLKAIGDSRGIDLKYLKIGEGPNVFFATYSVHGYEDLWARDGIELSMIAYQLKDKLLQMQDEEINKKWTIYIIPEVNPDGKNYGWTNYGPGRTTLYSWAPGNKGIDINRSWQVGNKYTRHTDSRNYNGTEGFQCYEIKYLREFLLSKRATNGQTVLVDLHGWTQQLIGDPTICGFYSKQFPENNKNTIGQYGDGYLINWARMSLGANGRSARAALIELPNAGIKNHDDIVKQGLPTRYINATIDMLRNI